MLEVREDNNKISVETRPYLGYDNIVVKDMTSSRLFLLQAGDMATYIICSYKVQENYGILLPDRNKALLELHILKGSDGDLAMKEVVEVVKLQGYWLPLLPETLDRAKELEKLEIS